MKHIIIFIIALVIGYFLGKWVQVDHIANTLFHREEEPVPEPEEETAKETGRAEGGEGWKGTLSVRMAREL